MATRRRIIKTFIEDFLSSNQYKYKINEPLSKHTTLGIGGNADYFVEIGTEEQLILLLQFITSNKIKFYTIGGGSNLLFSDEGFKGIIIKLKGDFCKYEVIGNSVICGGGIGLGFLAQQTAQLGIGGLEYCVCIPGTVGGAVCGNAGIKGHSISDVIDKVEVIDFCGNKRILAKKDIKFEYRKSDLQSYIITRVFFTLKNTNKNDILKTISQEQEKRQKTQPVGTKNAGCIFKNPQNDSAGRLIDSLNLKKYTIGDIEVSSIHANFLINKNNGNATNMIELIEFIQNKVYERYNIKLETEIKIIK